VIVRIRPSGEGLPPLPFRTHVMNHAVEDMRLEADALADLVRVGRDPRRPTRWKARVTLEVRCEPKGHELGLVHATCVGPLLVLTRVQVGLPEGHVPRSVLHRSPYAVENNVGTPRNARPREDDHEFAGSAQIISDSLQRFVIADPESAQYFGATLFCRCGRRFLDFRPLVMALRSGAPRLLV